MSETQREAAQHVVIVNEKGLHARAAARLSRLASEFDSRVSVAHEGETANANSIMDLLLLAAAIGCEVEIRAHGPDAQRAVTAIASLVADGFGENPTPES
jgi:phosphocarrier protein HPr